MDDLTEMPWWEAFRPARYKDCDVIVIDADEYEAALNDPKVHEMWRRAAALKQKLIESGHCPQCLVVNCEHLQDDRESR